MINPVLVVTAAVLAFVGVDNEISTSDAPAGAVLVALGIMGAPSSASSITSASGTTWGFAQQ
jgi:hypothetical protein